MQKPCYDENGNKIGDADCSPLFEKAVWFVPLYNQRPAKLANEWHYFVRVDDNVGSWRIQEVNQNAGCGDRQNQPCIRITLHIKNDGHTTPDHSGFPEQLPTGTIPPRSKKCCNNDNEWEYPPYYEIVAQVEDLNQNSKGIVSIRLEVCLDEATCFDNDPNNNKWSVELVDGVAQECTYQPTGQASDRTKWCTFKLNALSRQGWGTVLANHPLRWRIIAQNTVCNAAVVRHNVNIYQTLACLLTGAVGQSCGAWCYRGRTGKEHDGVDINAPDGTEVVSPCSGRLKRIYPANYNCDPQNPPLDVPACGNGVRLFCDGGPDIVLCHLQEITHSDGRISVGEIIGTSDATGNACGCTPHLHYWF
ncbi:MAG: M23 family metallopeptidase [bacterium JZ-2024 1]